MSAESPVPTTAPIRTQGGQAAQYVIAGRCLADLVGAQAVTSNHDTASMRRPTGNEESR
jgi:hypothetical protein